jgi:elongator complex protein 3
MSRKEAIESIIGCILAGERDLDQVKRKACRRFKISMIKNPEILENFPAAGLTQEIRDLLLKKPTKTLSGVTPVAVMIKPQDSCRWGCVFCPFTGLAAKSYTGFEPAALRGRQFGFDSYLQASSRVKQFEGGGHPTDKCEVIVMGGTFLEMEEKYKYNFIKGIYDGLNGFRSPTLAEAISNNEKSKIHRVIGLTIETRPDVCGIDEILSYGATRVELGVQHADDGIYRAVKRGHTVRHVIDSTKALKDSAFKVLYHVMPGLPGAGREKDIGSVKKLFEDENFKPDMLKIYPTLVVGGTILKQWADSGKYAPYTSEEAADIISEFYRHIPKYVRVMRIQRDIPANRIEKGVKKSNLRELVEEKIREKGIVPREIRYREIGLSGKLNKKTNIADFRLERFDYEASGGKEVFLSFDNADGFIAGFIRLRFPSSGIRPEITNEAALIRELHVYGSEIPIEAEGRVQHKGLGSSLLREAEGIARDAGRQKMVIISGVGVREYYRKFGYGLEGPYMAKKL